MFDFTTYVVGDDARLARLEVLDLPADHDVFSGGVFERVEQSALGKI